ncbi:hypothetical protein F2Q70_00044251 [Brassica cretica]|uniref:Uncharacterized protein n=1 Tax=Brassica cretica TaxID=69181 RepID=A0A8S9KDV7_BRACR|nr:hypothetical protein F2Q70_00044251 [Brassica cretica]
MNSFVNFLLKLSNRRYVLVNSELSKLSPSHVSVVVLDVLIWHSNNQGSKAVKSAQLVLDFSEVTYNEVKVLGFDAFFISHIKVNQAV